jgi:hypothetical protein
MSALEILGSTEATPQGTKYRWQQGGGESKLYTWRGPTAAIAAIYDGFKNAALIDPTFVVMDYDEGKGLGTLTIQKADAESVIGTSVENGVTKLYEMFANEYLKPVHQNAWFTGDGGLTVDQIVEVYKAFDAQQTGVSFSNDLQTDLYDLLCKGTADYFESGYVIRESKIVNGRNAVRANFTLVNKVSAPPDNAAANTLIGSLPAGEWLKKSPIVRQITKTRWHIETEWWWAEKWSAVLYGGTGDP